MPPPCCWAHNRPELDSPDEGFLIMVQKCLYFLSHVVLHWFYGSEADLKENVTCVMIIIHNDCVGVDDRQDHSSVMS